LVVEIAKIIGKDLTGLYLYGSLVTGDFDNETSDIDLVAVRSTELDAGELDALERMHDEFARAHAAWEGRIEVQYLPAAALRTFKTRSSTIAVISPGEPFHVIEAGRDWMINWYVVQEKGVTLYGPSPRTLIEPISTEEFVETVRLHAQRWREWTHDNTGSRPAQAYAILTMCRALYTIRHGEQVSKRRAAQWAQGHLPQWAPLIEDALGWRSAWRDDQADPETTRPQTERFVQFMIDLIEKQ
jgi:hypothetical protein